MPTIAVEVEEAGERLSELADAVMQGQEVTITYLGAPVAVAALRSLTGETPPVEVREIVLDVLTRALRQLREHLDSEPWRMN